MKFRFQSRSGKKLSGTLEARSLEEAEAILERKNLSGASLEVCSEPVGKSYSHFFILLCTVGILLLAVSTFRSQFGVQSPAESQVAQKTLLRIEGQVLTDRKLDDKKLEIVFPELPTRLRADWEEVGEDSGYFSLQEELFTEGPSPSFFSLKIKSSTGKTLFQKRKVLYPISESKENLPTFRF